jgi:hypothetical protein
VATSLDAATPQPHRAAWARVVIAAIAPLAGVALAYLLWWISDRLVVIGPLDRATFGWLVVVPVWALTPTMAAYAWRALEAEETWLVAAAVALIMAALAALLFWLAGAFPDCDFGALRTPAEWILPSVIVGLVIGGGFAATCLVTVAVLRGGRWWSALLVGAGSALTLVLLAIMVAAPLMMSGGCQRPPV